jgi:hypothetical protein
MAFVPLGGEKRQTGRFQYVYYVEIVQLVRDGESQHGEIGQRPARFDGPERLRFPRLAENTLADDLQVAVEVPVKGVDAQVGHAKVIRVRVDEGDGQPAAPVLDDGPLFAGQVFLA